MNEQKEYELGQLLAYEQPTPYIVESTKYNDEYATPVLTAGKTFILGYTNEDFGIYDTLPVIIFDDFTTASRFVNFKFKVKSSAMKILTPNTELVDPKYIYYRMQVIECDHSTHKRYWISQYSKIKLSIPPIPEQRRIVAHIEEQLSQLDNGVETLEKTKLQLDVYRQAVLKAAFEGKLSIAWRHKNPQFDARIDFERIKLENAKFKDTTGDENAISLDLPSSWLEIRIGEILQVEVGSTPSRKNKDYWGGNINWLSSGEVHFCSISDTKEKITQEGLRNASTNVQPAGTVMLAMIGEGKTRGQAAILKTEAAHNQNTAAIIVPLTPCNPKFLYYFLLMNYENTRRIGSGNNQKALNKERVRALKIPFASFSEQQIITEKIESRLSVCDSIKSIIDTALQQADGLQRSILKKAFEESI